MKIMTLVKCAVIVGIIFAGALAAIAQGCTECPPLITCQIVNGQCQMAKCTMRVNDRVVDGLCNPESTPIPCSCAQT